MDKRTEAYNAMRMALRGAPQEHRAEDGGLRWRIRLGWIAGLVQAGFAIVMYLYIAPKLPQLRSSEGGQVLADLVQYLPIDIAIMLGAALGTFFQSRIAAVIQLLHCVAAVALTAVATGNVRGVGGAMIFMMLYGNAVFGTFKLHRLK